jgi:hypothetical protein
MDYSTIAGAADFATVGTGILAVGVALAAIYVGIKGARMLLGFLRR